MIISLARLEVAYQFKIGISLVEIIKKFKLNKEQALRIHTQELIAEGKIPKLICEILNDDNKIIYPNIQGNEPCSKLF
ncbi:MAG: hypothetical protein COA88_11770 [Kordia sp.]|nr:MAG: hypothetical protein COA88_11770 [Kordia sp.]